MAHLLRLERGAGNEWGEWGFLYLSRWRGPPAPARTTKVLPVVSNEHAAVVEQVGKVVGFGAVRGVAAVGEAMLGADVGFPADVAPFVSASAC